MEKGTLLLLMLLPGTNSISDIRQNKPDWVFKSEKTVYQVAECILSLWEKSRGVFGISYISFTQFISNGKTVYINGYFSVVDVSSSNGQIHQLSYTLSQRETMVISREIVYLNTTTKLINL